MRKICLLTLFVCICASQASAATWSHFESADEMRGKKTAGASMEALASDDPSSKLTVSVIKSSENSQGVVFKLTGASRISCKESLCEIPVRFGDGTVSNQTMSLDNDRGMLFPTDSTAFAGSISLVTKFFIEIPTESGGRKQFKFEPESPAFPRVYNPEFKVAGISLGGSIDELPSSFKPAKSGISTDCKEARDVSIGSGAEKVPAARLCFFNSQLYMVFLDSLNKAQHSAISKRLTEQLGSADPDSYIESWPDNKGKLIDQHTVTATFWPDPKVKGAGQFMIMDKAIAELVPK
jgi:hypothetical protein